MAKIQLKLVRRPAPEAPVEVAYVDDKTIVIRA